MDKSDVKALNEEAISRLPLSQRLALSYAPRLTRDAFFAFFALDNALADIIRQAREPMLAQIRLAWWRDTLAKAAQDRPQGNPLLDLIGKWPVQSDALQGLVDGWEAVLADGLMDADSMRMFARGRGECYAVIARVCASERDREAAHSGEFWALVDLCEGLSDGQERALAQDLARQMEPVATAFARPMRPLSILSGLAHRALHRDNGAILSSKGDMLAAVRLGLFGR